MYKPNSIRNVPLKDSEGRQTRYLMPPQDFQLSDPFLLWADVRYPHGYFADHPHKGIQTATYVLDGAITHYDNFSGRGRLETNDFQIMTSGNGIIHNEDPDAGTTARVLQLWINLSPENKKQHASYVDILSGTTPQVVTDGVKINVLAGALGNVAHIENPTPVNIYEGTITSEFELPIAKGYNSYFYVLEGSGTLNGEAVDTFDLAHFEETTDAQVVRVTANERMRFMFISGEPIKAPVVAHGPFVMNTMAEIQQAFLDYERGVFVPN